MSPAEFQRFDDSKSRHRRRGSFPSTAAFDHGVKLEGYFSLASLAHYLIVDPERRVIVQHSRGREGVIETRILRKGEIRLDPPGLAFDFAELFGD